MSKKILLKPLKALASPGIYLFYKFNQYKRERREQSKKRITEKQLNELNYKIEKLINKLDDKDGEIATQPEEECVICINAKAIMQTYPCGHKVVCRKCFLKTIQSALSQRSLPLKCVVCRTKVLRLKRSPGKKYQRNGPGKITTFNNDGNNNNNNNSNNVKWKRNIAAGSMGGKTWVVPNTASRHSLQPSRLGQESNFNFNSRRTGCDGFGNKSCLSETAEHDIPSSTIRKRTIRCSKGLEKIDEKTKRGRNRENNSSATTIIDNNNNSNNNNNNNNDEDNDNHVNNKDDIIRLPTSSPATTKEPCKSEKGVGLLSRDELIRKFQRDFREGKQPSYGKIVSNRFLSNAIMSYSWEDIIKIPFH